MSGRILSAAQVDDMLDYIGVEKRRWKSNGDECQITCPVHREKNPSCGISVSKQLVHCFSCGFAGTFDYFLFKSLPDEFKSILDAANFIRRRYKVDLDRFKDHCQSGLLRYEDFFEVREETRVTKPLYSIAPFMSGKETYQYFYDRGFNDWTLHTFKVGRDLDNQTITVPIFWEDNQLAGVIGRYLFPRSSAERYKVYDFERSSLLFPANLFEPEDETVILVEGVFDAMRLYQMGYKNVLALMTNKLTKEQRNFLVRYCSKVILMLDNDERGVLSSAKIISQLKDSVDLYTLNYPQSGKDPCDWSEQEIFKMLKSKQNYFKRNLVRI